MSIRSVAAVMTVLALMTAAPSARAGIIGDIVLVLDESGSIDQIEFQQEKAFASNVINALTFGPTSVQLGLAMFASTSRTIINLQPNKQVALNATNGVIQFGGGTVYSAAIDRGVDILFNSPSARTGVPKIMIFLSDGADVGVAAQTDAAIDAMNNLGVVTFSIGVGLSTCTQCLTTLTEVANGDPDHVFSVNGFSDLNAILNLLLMTAMAETTPPPSVPEATTLALFGLGLAGFILVARRRIAPAV